MDFKKDIILENTRVLLRPLHFQDFKGLFSIATDPLIWNYMPLVLIKDASDLHNYIKTARSQRRKSTRYPFVIIDKKTGQAAGSTSYLNIFPVDKRLEIGSTWLGAPFRGSGINKHCKFLLLKYAFETLEYERIELKTDALNLQSRRAIQKIGAKEEGILRSHTLMNGGRRRDTVYYSILKNEWPEIKSKIFEDVSAL